MKIKSDDKEVGQLLKAEYFEIPRFQRPYSWESEQIEDFWADTITAKEQDYFIGSMVVFRQPNTVLSVVDGQQRLTTIVMTLCAVRDAFNAEGLEQLGVGLNTYIQRPNLENKIDPVLHSETSYPYLHSYIIDPDPDKVFDSTTSAEEETLENGFIQIKEYVSQTVNSVKHDASINDNKKKDLIVQKLSLIRDRILSLKLIFVEVDNEDDAHLIFETLNTRGKDLSTGDLVKNHLTRLITARGKKTDFPVTQWQRILETIHNADADISLDNFLHHYWLSTNVFLPQKKLFKELKRSFNTKSKAQRLLSELQKEVIWYREIFEPGSRKWLPQEKEIKRSLESLLVFRVKQPVPMVLSLLRAWNKKRIKLKTIKRALTAIENFHFVFTAITSQRSSGGISQMYAKSARELNTAESLLERDQVINELLLKLKSKQPSYDEFALNFRDLIFTRNYTKERTLIKYTLGKIHNSFNLAHPIRFADMSIEHLIPISLGGDEPSEKFESNVGQLGNLLLVPGKLNASMGDKEVSDKLKILKKSGYQFDPILATAPEFDFGVAEMRTKKLAKHSYEVIWKLH